MRNSPSLDYRLRAERRPPYPRPAASSEVTSTDEDEAFIPLEVADDRYGRLQFELPLDVTDEEIAYIKGPVSGACCATPSGPTSFGFELLPSAVGWNWQSLRRQTPTDGRCPPSLIVQSSPRQGVELRQADQREHRRGSDRPDPQRPTASAPHRQVNP